MAEDHAPLWTSKELIHRRMSFAQHPATIANWFDAM